MRPADLDIKAGLGAREGFDVLALNLVNGADRQVELLLEKLKVLWRKVLPEKKKSRKDVRIT